MCGIAGLMTAAGRVPDRLALERMMAALAHRGPDGHGRYFAGNVAMAHARLAIIDLATGDQPLHEPGGGALIGNGEIYNYVELRRHPALFGINLRSGSDFEPPLHLFRRKDLDFLDDLRGMYALALHDVPTGRLILARDPFGIKPLYYVARPGLFAFASEPRAFLAAGLIDAAVEPACRDELLEMQFSTGRETPLRGVHRVLPGEALIVVDARVVARRRRRALPPLDAAAPPASEDDALARLDAALRDSMTAHRRADVDCGIFLSAGVDSAVVLAQLVRSGAAPAAAFTVGFSGAGAEASDERPAARRLADRFGIRHVALDFGAADFWTLLPRAADALDDPVADYAALPSLKLAAEAAGTCKVIFSGEGGDELFGGYGRYRRAMRPRWRAGRAMRARGTIERARVLARRTRNWRDGLAAIERAEAGGGRSRLQTAQAVDIAGWLPNNILTKLDRCLMARGIEGRVPLLDAAIADAAFGLPDAFKVRRGRGKWLLRRWLAEAAPEADALAGKRGFTVPVGPWIAAQAERIGPLVARQAGVREICTPRAVECLFARRDGRSSAGQWSLLFYACWHQRHIVGVAGARDAFEHLAA
ncbi:MAG TPA: asparagine synthase (glutamine-hydrolyzing) [Alphaproteobacteria bacterium]|jgi:asparagine synthase (glutamine-hydrolysing)|nr:asparagine synthase (glutamine-hydrolyzing) [Alphaproteobacteria bacterium]